MRVMDNCGWMWIGIGSLFMNFHVILAQVLPKNNDFCQLLPDHGPCRETQRRFYYDIRADNCTLFVYGGCLGNQNNFESPERCEFTCRRSRSVQASAFGYVWPSATGLGPNIMDDQRRSSSSLGVDGRGNTNVLLAPSSLHDCDQTVQRGFCSSFIPRWHHNGSSCELFYYSGCGGNSNNYITREACQERCSMRISAADANVQLQSTSALSPIMSRAECQVRPQRGNCRSAIIRWYYDAETALCMEFVYSGCNGNENNYPSRQECDQRCSRNLRVISVGRANNMNDPFASPVNSLGNTGNERNPDQFADAGLRPGDVVMTNGGGFSPFEGNVPQRCLPDFERGPCTVDMERWYYDIKTGNCRPFYYGGCLGNTNRFSSRKECETTCTVSSEKIIVPTSSLEVCLQEPATGSCQQLALTRFYFDASVGQCRQFTYGGCEGTSGNNFPTIEECESRCRSVRPGLDSGRLATTTPPFGRPEVFGSAGGTTNSQPEARCSLPSDTGPCRAALMKWFFNGRACEVFTYGGCAGNDNRFDSPDACFQTCGGDPLMVTDVGQNIPLPPGSGRSDGGNQQPTQGEVCQLAPESGLCKASFQRFYNDPASGSCKSFSYGGCGGNLNNFRSATECEANCRSFRSVGIVNSSVPAVCTLPAERGSCRAFIPAFFHDIRDGRCKMFYFGGCQGNDNRFPTRQECESVCTGGGGTGTGFGFGNQVGRSDGPGVFGSTSALGRTSMCELPAEPGNCLAMIPTFFYDSDLAMCRQFVYGGCGGNANRFSSIEECQNNCQTKVPMMSKAATAPAIVTQGKKNPDCLLPLESGPCLASFTAYGFDPNQQTCVDFIYGGCNGNKNKFASREDCMAQCGGLIASDNTNMMRLQQINSQTPPLILQQQRTQRRL